MKLILTCEHGGNEIPRDFKFLFRNAARDIESHRGYDKGALDLFKTLVPISDGNKYSQISRLLVDLNRTSGHPNQFSEYSRKLGAVDKKELQAKYYSPYRDEIQSWMERQVELREQIIHLSIHTFTPVLNGLYRKTDVGLLYDPSREMEKSVCLALRRKLRQNNGIGVRLNYPYKGVSDGLTTYLRKHLPKSYMGIEIEVNQKFVRKNTMSSRIKNLLKDSVNSVLSEMI